MYIYINSVFSTGILNKMVKANKYRNTDTVFYKKPYIFSVVKECWVNG